MHVDGGYNRRPVVDVPFHGVNLSVKQLEVNKKTASVRVTVECSYQEVKLNWSSFAFKRKLKIGEGGVGLLYFGALLLHNTRSCLYPNPVSQFFNCHPSFVEELIHHKN